MQLRRFWSLVDAPSPHLTDYSNAQRLTSNHREGTIFGLGNPLLDISASVDAAFLAKHDLKANNAILAEERHAKLGEEMRSAYDVKFTAGGSCQNTIRVAQWLLRKTVGERSSDHT